MIKYKDNEQYERDKAALIRIAEGGSIITLIENADVIADLLKQSKWIDAVDVTAFDDGYREGYIDDANDFAKGEDND